MEVSAAILDELVRRTIATAHPLRIVLFGSASRGTMSPDSDIDLLVVVPDGTNGLHVAQALYRQMRGLGVAQDFVVVTESHARRQRDDPNTVVHAALREGRELYRAAA